MSKYGSNSIVYEYDNAAGTLVDMTQHTLEISGVEIEALLEETHSFGDAWFESLATGLRKMNDLTIGGLYDDTATTGPDAIYQANIPTGPSSTSKTAKVTWGGTKTTAVETFLSKYSRLPARGAITKYNVVLRPIGAPTEV